MLIIISDYSLSYFSLLTEWVLKYRLDITIQMIFILEFNLNLMIHNIIASTTKNAIKYTQKYAEINSIYQKNSKR